jgi:molybdopterin synthase sulfur carrier subunit
MKINYFGEIAEITNQTSESLVLKNASLSKLLLYLQSTYKIQVEDIHIAVNHEIIAIDKDINLKETDEIAVLSPFAGG